MRWDSGVLRIENGVWGTLTAAMLIPASDAVKGVRPFLAESGGFRYP